MPLRFNQLLVDAGIDPSEVRLLRHLPTLPNRKHLLDLWHSDARGFEDFQALQERSKRAYFAHRYWASFIGTWDGRTVFAGLWEVDGLDPVDDDIIVPLAGSMTSAGTVDRYRIQRMTSFDPFAGRLFIDWGGGSSGKRAWVQRADLQNKAISALAEQAIERPFPGYMAFGEPLSTLGDIPPTWIKRLSEQRGIYLLACPEAGWLYTGSATGAGGFWVRWGEYLANGHGGNLGLKDIDTSKVNVAILQVAGSADSVDDILAMEELWKVKLQTRAFGRNRN